MPPSKMAGWFRDRRWRVVTEAHGTGFVPLPNAPEDDLEGGYIPVVFDHGKFTVGTGGAFRSPLSGNPGLKGILLQEVDADGNDIEGSREPFGEPAVRAAREEFNAIVG